MSEESSLHGNHAVHSHTHIRNSQLLNNPPWAFCWKTSTNFKSLIRFKDNRDGEKMINNACSNYSWLQLNWTEEAFWRVGETSWEKLTSSVAQRDRRLDWLQPLTTAFTHTNTHTNLLLGSEKWKHNQPWSHQLTSNNKNPHILFFKVQY